ncbi:MAG: extracellular solute-binding protein, partial [Rhizobiales bacterium]|nr:extracellular solute-binding protein [Hyphomicrobiales bacterium]
NQTFATQWGEANDTEVIVDNVGYGEISTRALAEIQAQRGHDLVQFVTPHAMLYEHIIDHREVFEECSRRFGQPTQFAVRANYNPSTDRYLGFAPSFQPAVVVYRKDLWGAIGTNPISWADVLSGARQIKLLHDKPVGISLASEHNCEQTLRSIMYSFGSSEQDADQKPTLKSAATLEALNYVKELYEQSMTRDVVAWDGASNNRFMLTGEGCLTIDSLSILRASETLKPAFGGNLALAPMPEGPSARLGSFGNYNYVIWKFAENVEGAKQFLVDYVGRSREAFLASGFQNMPCYPETIPDLAALTSGQDTGMPPSYGLMKDVPTWTTNVGHPGPTNPAISEVYDKGLISKMFAAVATGRLTPDAALDEATREEQNVYERWKESGVL